MIRFIQTLYIDKKYNAFQDGLGWIRPEFNMMGWTLSCLQLHKLYGKVELYANSAARHLLIDILELPYTEVHNDLDNLKLENRKLWALPKIYTYSLQETPFLHIDGDIFLFKKFPLTLLESDLIAQNKETFTSCYKKTQKELMEHLTYFPTCIQDDFTSSLPSYAINAGLLGGKNISFFKEYTAEAFYYVEKNLNNLTKIDINNFNIFFEQHLFYTMAIERNLSIKYMFLETFNDNNYENFGDFHEVPYKRSYLHLLGGYKKDTFTCLQMADMLKELYPDYFYKIINLFKSKKISLYTKLYDHLTDYPAYHHKSLEVYRSSLPSYNKQKSFTPLKDTLPQLRHQIELYLTNIKNTQQKQAINEDFSHFCMSFELIKKDFCERYSPLYINGRNLSSFHWYRNIFADKKHYLNKIICKDEMTAIVQSKYDWGRFYQEFNSCGSPYYENTLLEEGNFYCLIINNDISLYDLDELEKTILEKLSTPQSIKNLIVQMRSYANEEIIKFYLTRFDSLILSFLHRLVLIKAIRPLEK